MRVPVFLYHAESARFRHLGSIDVVDPSLIQRGAHIAVPFYRGLCIEPQPRFGPPRRVNAAIEFRVVEITLDEGRGPMLGLEVRDWNVDDLPYVASWRAVPRVACTPLSHHFEGAELRCVCGDAMRVIAYGFRVVHREIPDAVVVGLWHKLATEHTEGYVLVVGFSRSRGWALRHLRMTAPADEEIAALAMRVDGAVEFWLPPEARREF